MEETSGVTDAREVHDESETTEMDQTKGNGRKGWSRFHITIEPIKLCMGFTMAFTNGVTVDVIQRNICRVNYNLSLDDCLKVSDGTKSAIDGYTAEVNMLNQLATGFFPLLLVIFVGPWSDTNGRKPFILIPLFGFAVYYLSWAVMSFFPDIPAMYLCIPSIPLGMSGSMVSIYVCTWSYTCDNFESQFRPMRFSVSVAMMVSGNLLGNSLSGQVVKLSSQYGYLIIFASSFVAIIIIFFYTLFILEETIERPQDCRRTNLFDLKNVKDLFTVILIRPEKGRLISYLVMTVLLCEIPLNSGDDGIIYLVGKSQYSWTLEDYNLIAALSSAASALFPVLLMGLMTNVLNVSNMTMLIFSCCVMCLGENIKALSVNQVMFWMGVLVLKATSVIGPCIDTELSKTVNNNHSGKAFTMTSICDSLAPMIGIPLYTLVYKAFLPDHTLYVFFISASLATICLIGSVGLFFKESSVAYSRFYDSEETT